MTARNIALLNATYSAVPAVQLPISGGGTATFTEITDTTASAADVSSGKYFYTAAGVKTEGTASGGGGGASNIVQGTFTTGSTTGTAETFSINYTGSGYPIALMVYVDGGAYNNGTGGNTTWYNSVQRYAVGAFYMTKSRIPTTPTYATSGADNYGTVAVIYKNSTSQATTYSRTSSMTANMYTSSSTNANATATTTVRFKGNGKTVTYFVAASSYGLLASTKYAYIAVYSS